MKTPKKFLTRKQSRLFRSIIATAFIANGFFPFVAPAFAEGTTAGTPINNTATATYEDPNAPGTTINATSNPVIVNVAEVAGIQVTTTGVPIDSTPTTPIAVGDTLTYTFTIQNVGNDPTRFRIPNLATITGPAAIASGVNVKYSTDGGVNYTDINGTEFITNSIPVNGTILVQVPVQVQAGANAGDVITVQLGDTPGNAQNVLRVNNGGDVYTVDNADPNTIPAEIVGVPANGTREASAKQTSTVGASPKNLALATLLKTMTNYDNATTTGTILDDKITYGLSLRVESNDVTGRGITPNPLAGYGSGTVAGGNRVGISVDTDTSKDYILVSDVIPTGTQLFAAPTLSGALSAAGWQVVYSTDGTSNLNANTVLWTTTLPGGSLANVKRVGFVKQTTTTTTSGVSTTTGAIPVGTTVSGFNITVVASGATGTSFNINNIAQTLGQTPTLAGVPGLPVYDESGDQNPANYNGQVGNMTPGATSADGILPTDAAAVLANIGTGVATPSTDGVDATNDNTGSGVGGEDNVLVISQVLTTSILNGPLNAPAAIGPDGTTATDYTNKSSFIPAGTNPGSLIDPQAVAFSNTFTNNGTGSGTVTLAPTALTGNAKDDLPNGTKVTISYNGNSDVYTYVKADGTFTPPATVSISIPNVAAGATIGYGVEVDLPTGTKLSTDTIADYTNDTEWGYPVPIRSTITPASGTAASNITIDRVYTGFLQLVKVSRILQGTGTAVAGNQGSFESTPAYVNGSVTIDPNPSVTDEPRKPTPGNIIEYQIRYKNISSGSDQQVTLGNVVLKASNVKIVEDGTGTTTASNNWAKDNDASGQPGFGIIDTSNVTNPQAVDSGSGTVQFYSGATGSTVSSNQSGTTQNTDVTKYVDLVNGVVSPQENGTFTFQRTVN